MHGHEYLKNNYMICHKMITYQFTSTSHRQWKSFYCQNLFPSIKYNFVITNRYDCNFITDDIINNLTTANIIF